MNPLFLLLGLFGMAMSSSSKSSTPTGSSSNGQIPVSDPDDTDGGMDMGGDDGGSDMGGDDGGMDMGGDDGGMDMGGDDGGHNHGDMGTPAITPPGVGASQSEINTYINALANLGESHIHDSSSSMAGEHAALLDLVPRDDATHVAIGNGDWEDASIWSNGEVPGDDARVLIPDGVSVDYSTVSDARIFTVRVEGALDFATNADSQMIFDTFVVSPTGHLIMGTADNPVQPNVDIDLIVANNGPIDTNWDPMLLSRGLVSHGDVTVHGAEKDSHEKVDDDPMAGDTSVSFAETPEGWQVGDTIVIAGTYFDGYKWDNDVQGSAFHPPEDEVRVITEINGGQVFFEEPLVYDHDTPRDDLTTSVANYTRNISIESEDGAASEIFERGHVMFMHSDEVDVRFMEFTELGRTDKSEDSQNTSDMNNVNFDSNAQGRYSLHLHRTGLDDPENPTILEGNAVYGSPGWGVVHHDSNAIVDNNATYDTFGAGFVAETGNEIGIWSDNIAIFAQGNSWGTPKNTSDINGTFDTARGGDGFWFQGRMVAAVDNVAASVNTGFVYFHRDDGEGMIDFDSSLFDLSDALYNDESVTADDVPIMIFEGNETFAAREGLHIVKANTAQGHDVWSRLDDFTAWSVRNGVELEYTSHYILSDFDLIAKEPTQFSNPQDGITFGNNLTEIVVIDSRIEGFENGIDLNSTLTAGRSLPDGHGYFVIDTEIVNVDNDFINRDSNDTILDNTPSSNYDVDLTLNMQLTSGQSISITGTKTDGLGQVDFPGGIDDFTIGRNELVSILETTGYWSTSSGQNYTLIDVYFTDRLTSDIYYETQPVFLSGVPVGGGDWANSINNGVQNTGSYDPVAVPAPTLESMTPSIDALTSSSSMVNSMVHSSVQLAGSVPEMAEMSDDEMAEMVDIMATQSAEPETGATGTLAVFEAAAMVDMDGAPIEELLEEEVEACADTTLALELAGLSVEDGAAFTQMGEADIAAIFDEAIEGGLGDLDARIVVDYENDTVSMELVTGSGAVSVEALGGDEDKDGEQALWDALTAGHGVICDMPPVDEDEEDLLAAVA